MDRRNNLSCQVHVPYTTYVVLYIIRKPTRLALTAGMGDLQLGYTKCWVTTTVCQVPASLSSAFPALETPYNVLCFSEMASFT